MKAIETKYKGYRFRSRLEARWAVFFDACGYSWEYEPEGFDLEGIYYLPDFKIFGKDDNGDYNVFWLEVKPEGPISSLDSEKISAFSRLIASQRDIDADWSQCLVKGYGDFILLDGTPEPNKLYRGLTTGLKWLMDESYRGRPSFWEDIDDVHFIYSVTKKPNFIKGGRSPYDKARSARFEHGEQG